METKELRGTINFLKAEIKQAQKLIKPSATGHIHTTINFLTNRINVLEKQYARQTYPFTGDEDRGR